MWKIGFIIAAVGVGTSSFAQARVMESEPFPYDLSVLNKPLPPLEEGVPSLEVNEASYRRLRDLAQGFVKTLSRDIYLYSYYKNKSEYGNPDSESIAATARQRAAIYNDPDNVSHDDTQNQLGLSLYLALDPFASMQFSFPDVKGLEPEQPWPFLLFSILVKRGTHFLDIRGKNAAQPLVTGSMIKIDDCWVESVRGLLYDHARACRHLRKRLLDDLRGIGLIFYPWMPTQTTRFAQCGAHPVDGAILNLADSLDFNESKALTDKLPPSGSDTADLTRDFVQNLFENRQFNVADVLYYPLRKFTPLWNQKAKRVLSSSSYEAMAKEKIMGCGKNYVEDGVSR